MSVTMLTTAEAVAVAHWAQSGPSMSEDDDVANDIIGNAPDDWPAVEALAAWVLRWAPVVEDAVAWRTAPVGIARAVTKTNLQDSVDAALGEP